jgi:hypothetical protein
MGAIDAYGGSLPADNDEDEGVHRTPAFGPTKQVVPLHQQLQRPPLSSASSYVTAPDADTSDAASEYADTESGETDDEPTIRAGRSVAGSECASDAGSAIWRDDEDDDGEMGSP